MADYITELLQAAHRKSVFDCGRSSLNDYLHKQAKQDVKRKLAACFVLKSADNSVKGYYTLANASIQRALVPEKVKTKLPPAYKDLPATLLGRLAIDLRYQGQKLGELLSMDAFRRSYMAVASIGSMAVIVDSLDDAAERFYVRYGFIKLTGSGKMFLPMASVMQLF